MNYNKINFFGGIVGGLVGLVASIGVPLCLRYSPQSVIFLVLGVFGYYRFNALISDGGDVFI